MNKNKIIEHFGSELNFIESHQKEIETLGSCGIFDYRNLHADTLLINPNGLRFSPYPWCDQPNGKDGHCEYFIDLADFMKRMDESHIQAIIDDVAYLENCSYIDNDSNYYEFPKEKLERLLVFIDYFDEGSNATIVFVANFSE
jgi:hypothetical protein